MSFKFAQAILATIAGLALSSYSSGQTISIKLGSNEGAIANTALTAGAIPVAGTLWNNMYGAAQATAQPLKDSTGALNVAQVSWSSANTCRSASGGATATSQNGILTKGYLDDGGSRAQINLSGIPYLSYNVYVICSTDGSGFTPVTVGGKTYTYNGTATVEGAANWGAGNPFSTANVLIEGKNYLKISGVTGANLNITGGPNANPSRGSIAGVQIENAESSLSQSYWNTPSGGVWWDAN